MIHNNNSQQQNKSNFVIPEIKIIPLEQLEQMSNDVNKKYFYIKNNYKEELEELQDSLGMSVNFIELLDNQHVIIKVNSYIYNNKYNRIIQNI
jgi:hypothetical protein